jgi:hypothetical protein
MPLNSLFSWVIQKRVIQIERFKKKPLEVQHELLFLLLKKAKNTRWGKQHNLDCTMAVLYLNNKISKPTSQIAGETIYGFAKSNLANNFGRKGAGSTSYAVSKASEVYGWLHRDKYVSDSGAVIDLSDETRYSVVWGENPGSGVPSWLHPIAAKTKVVGMVRAENAMHAGKLIQAGYAVDFSGNISWPRTRREDGVGTSWSGGAHMVSFTGVRWGSDGSPQYFWLANTGHGNHVSGPVGPIPVPIVYAQCGGWIGATYANNFFTGIRNHAHTMVTGWPIMQLGGWGLGEWL